MNIINITLLFCCCLIISSCSPLTKTSHEITNVKIVIFNNTRDFVFGVMENNELVLKRVYFHEPPKIIIDVPENENMRVSFISKTNRTGEVVLNENGVIHIHNLDDLSMGENNLGKFGTHKQHKFN